MGTKVIILNGKSGYYWRANSCGYTACAHDAGIYDSDEMAYLLKDTDRRDQFFPVPENHISVVPDLRTQLAAATTALAEAQGRVTGLEERASKAENQFRHLAASINYHCKHEIDTLQTTLAASEALSESRRVALEALDEHGETCTHPDHCKVWDTPKGDCSCGSSPVQAMVAAALSATPSMALAARDREVRVRCLEEFSGRFKDAIVIACPKCNVSILHHRDDIGIGRNNHPRDANTCGNCKEMVLLSEWHAQIEADRIEKGGSDGE